MTGSFSIVINDCDLNDYDTLQKELAEKRKIQINLEIQTATNNFSISYIEQKIAEIRDRNALAPIDIISSSDNDKIAILPSSQEVAQIRSFTIDGNNCHDDSVFGNNINGKYQIGDCVTLSSSKDNVDMLDLCDAGLLEFVMTLDRKMGPLVNCGEGSNENDYSGNITNNSSIRNSVRDMCSILMNKCPAILIVNQLKTIIFDHVEFLEDLSIIHNRSMIDIAIERKFISMEVAKSIRYNLFEGRNPVLAGWKEYINWDYTASENDIRKILDIDGILGERTDMKMISKDFVLESLYSMNKVLLSLQLESLELQRLIRDVEEINVDDNNIIYDETAPKNLLVFNIENPESVNNRNTSAVSLIAQNKDTSTDNNNDNDCIIKSSTGSGNGSSNELEKDKTNPLKRDGKKERKKRRDAVREGLAREASIGISRDTSAVRDNKKKRDEVQQGLALEATVVYSDKKKSNGVQQGLARDALVVCDNNSNENSNVDAMDGHISNSDNNCENDIAAKGDHASYIDKDIQLGPDSNDKDLLEKTRPNFTSFPSGTEISDGILPQLKPCYNLLRTGVCMRGKKCIFSHDTELLDQARPHLTLLKPSVFDVKSDSIPLEGMNNGVDYNYDTDILPDMLDVPSHSSENSKTSTTFSESSTIESYFSDDLKDINASVCPQNDIQADDPINTDGKDTTKLSEESFLLLKKNIEIFLKNMKEKFMNLKSNEAEKIDLKKDAKKCVSFVNSGVENGGLKNIDILKNINISKSKEGKSNPLKLSANSEYQQDISAQKSRESKNDNEKKYDSITSTSEIYEGPSMVLNQETSLKPKSIPFSTNNIPWVLSLLDKSTISASESGIISNDDSVTGGLNGKKMNNEMKKNGKKNEKKVNREMKGYEIRNNEIWGDPLLPYCSYCFASQGRYYNNHLDSQCRKNGRNLQGSPKVTIKNNAYLESEVVAQKRKERRETKEEKEGYINGIEINDGQLNVNKKNEIEEKISEDKEKQNNFFETLGAEGFENSEDPLAPIWVQDFLTSSPMPLPPGLSFPSLRPPSPFPGLLSSPPRLSSLTPLPRPPSPLPRPPSPFPGLLSSSPQPPSPFPGLLSPSTISNVFPSSSPMPSISPPPSLPSYPFPSLTPPHPPLPSAIPFPSNFSAPSFIPPSPLSSITPTPLIPSFACKEPSLKGHSSHSHFSQEPFLKEPSSQLYFPTELSLKDPSSQLYFSQEPSPENPSEDEFLHDTSYYSMLIGRRISKKNSLFNIGTIDHYCGRGMYFILYGDIGEEMHVYEVFQLLLPYGIGDENGEKDYGREVDDFDEEGVFGLGLVLGVDIGDENSGKDEDGEGWMLGVGVGVGVDIGDEKGGKFEDGKEGEEEEEGVLRLGVGLGGDFCIDSGDEKGEAGGEVKDVLGLGLGVGEHIERCDGDDASNLNKEFDVDDCENVEKEGVSDYCQRREEGGCIDDVMELLSLEHDRGDGDGDNDGDDDGDNNGDNYRDNDDDGDSDSDDDNDSYDANANCNDDNNDNNNDKDDNTNIKNNYDDKKNNYNNGSNGEEKLNGDDIDQIISSLSGSHLHQRLKSPSHLTEESSTGDDEFNSDISPILTAISEQKKYMELKPSLNLTEECTNEEIEFNMNISSPILTSMSQQNYIYQQEQLKKLESSLHLAQTSPNPNPGQPKKKRQDKRHRDSLKKPRPHCSFCFARTGIAYNHLENQCKRPLEGKKGFKSQPHTEAYNAINAQFTPLSDTSKATNTQIPLPPPLEVKTIATSFPRPLTWANKTMNKQQYPSSEDSKSINTQILQPPSSETNKTINTQLLQPPLPLAEPISEVKKSRKTQLSQPLSFTSLMPAVPTPPSIQKPLPKIPLKKFLTPITPLNPTPFTPFKPTPFTPFNPTPFTPLTTPASPSRRTTTIIRNTHIDRPPLKPLIMNNMPETPTLSQTLTAPTETIAPTVTPSKSIVTCPLKDIPVPDNWDDDM